MPAITILEVEKGEVLAGDNRRNLYIPAWIFLFLCPIIVGVRVRSRKKTDGGLGADDYTIMVSVVFAMATHIFALWGCANGYGKHGASLTDYQARQALKSFYLAQITYKISLNLTKMSILFLYLRIFGTVNWLRRTCYILLVFLGLYCVIATAVTIFQCTPVAAAFEKNRTHSKCIYLRAFWYTTAAISITTDFVIFFLPMPPIWALQMPRSKKVALMFVFALGTLAVTASIRRIITLDAPLKGDPIFDVQSTTFSLIEISLAIICACLPQMSRFATKLCPKVKSAYANMKTKLSTKKSSDSSRQVSEEEEGRWTQIGSQNGVELTNVIRGDTGSEIPSPPESRGRQTKILKTVDYTLEYSKAETIPQT